MKKLFKISLLILVILPIFLTGCKLDVWHTISDIAKTGIFENGVYQRIFEFQNKAIYVFFYNPENKTMGVIESIPNSLPIGVSVVYVGMFPEESQAIVFTPFGVFSVDTDIEEVTKIAIKIIINFEKTLKTIALKTDGVPI